MSKTTTIRPMTLEEKRVYRRKQLAAFAGDERSDYRKLVDQAKEKIKALTAPYLRSNLQYVNDKHSGKFGNADAPGVHQLVELGLMDKQADGSATIPEHVEQALRELAQEALDSGNESANGSDVPQANTQGQDGQDGQESESDSPPDPDADKVIWRIRGIPKA